ncbi:hypothetical protein CERZMDRAFT_101799 [Cercospora zeae-maydis SCOH1-5]|uniref:Uncharacterized protein n=1 Tax=Cercospora zeae-maydis SCOH1-5 TaxID=717836 RepID=A0A6A6F6Y4_9PEZI|nr:hypothetical protein CERZMDRAFT_101799 [Cercospora zeae-maydis SCOH1-5]
MQIHSRCRAAALVALTLAPLALAIPASPDAAPQPCISKPDHSNYGPQLVGGVCQSFCQWSADSFFKQQGVGCTTDSQCSKSMFPLTNCRDSDSVDADAVIRNGAVFCGYSKGDSGPTECFIGQPTNNRPDAKKAGIKGGCGTAGQGGASDPKTYCRDLLSSLGFTDVNVLAGCIPAENNPDCDDQCIFTCNGGPSCGPKADPRKPHKYAGSLDSCPGFENAT